MSVSGKVQRALYIILFIALGLVLAPWLWRWHFVVWDWYIDYIMKVFAS